MLSPSPCLCSLAAAGRRDAPAPARLALLGLVLSVLSLAPAASANTFLRWTQSSGAGLEAGGLVSNGSYVNQYGATTALNTVLSEGIVEQFREGVVEQTVDYRVRLHAANLLFYNEADDRTNNAFVIHANGQADWYSAITGSGTVALAFEFFSRDAPAGTPEAVELSLTSPHTQPDGVDPLAAEVKRLHPNEVYDIQMVGPLGAATRTFTDAYNQIQQGLAAGTMSDGAPASFSFGWAAPGFGNDLNTNGNLEVGEAQFTFDLSAAESFVISRSQDNGKRSAIGITAEGFFGGSEELVPEPGSGLMLLAGLLALRRARPTR